MKRLTVRYRPKTQPPGWPWGIYGTDGKPYGFFPDHLQAMESARSWVRAMNGRVRKGK